MKAGLRYLGLILSFLLFFTLEAQNERPINEQDPGTILLDSSSNKNGFWRASPQFNKAKFYGLTGGALGIYSGITIALSTTWYSEFDQSSFHFYNDNGEWLQMDKFGHSWTTYAEARYGMHLYEWTGLSQRKAAWLGVAWAMTAQLTIEVLDGFSAKWGASPGDLLANTSGAALLLAQEYAWQEQRFLLKFSSGRVDYSMYDPSIQERANNLFGATNRERILKDYNGQSYWLSFKPARVLGRTSRMPNWLTLSLGYGAEGILGGFENEWENAEGEIIVRNDIPRTRRYFLSLDIDFSQIETRNVFLRTLFDAVNILKVPAPSLEINSRGDLKFHPLYW